ncbi:hypothetical protein [Euzebya tangerina]|uniref:hypothetical protein n=1 Tax=Euzebya tangerina TaxID=591198 RepID=UPI000E30B76B|nr:hypothetical protein [Euzebya tangerina]
MAEATKTTAPNRQWLAIGIGTFFVTVSFWAMAYGLAVASAGTPADPGADGASIATAGVALSVALMPLGFGVTAWVSKRPDWPIAVLSAMGLALAVGLPTLIFRNPLASLMAGYAAGAVVALARPLGTTWHNRAIAAAIATTVVLIGMSMLFLPTAIIAPALPFTAMGLADLFTDQDKAIRPAPTPSIE